MEQGKGGEGGQRFPSTAIHDLISLPRNEDPLAEGGGGGGGGKMESGSVGEVSGTSKEEDRMGGGGLQRACFQCTAVKHSPHNS